MVVARKTFIVNSEQARQQAERRFKRDERLRDGRSADTKLKQFAKRPIVDRTIAEAQHGELYSGAADGDLRPMQYVPAVEKLHDSGFYFCWSIVRKHDRCDDHVAAVVEGDR